MTNKHEPIRAWMQRDSFPLFENSFKAIMWFERMNDTDHEIIIDTPEGREAFARMCFEAGIARGLYISSILLRKPIPALETPSVDDFIKQLREKKSEKIN